MHLKRLSCTTSNAIYITSVYHKWQREFLEQFLDTRRRIYPANATVPSDSSDSSHIMGTYPTTEAHTTQIE